MVPAANLTSNIGGIMDYLFALGSLAIIQLLAVVSPGPSFVVVTKTALTDGARTAGLVALGLGAGTLLWAGAAILGLALVLEELTLLYRFLKIAGGLYLLYVAVMVWRGAGEPVHQPEETGRRLGPAKAVLVGVLTQLANPKVVIFFGSIFIAVLPQGAPPWVYVVAVAIVFFNEVAWYGLVAFGFSRSGFRQGYGRLNPAIDRGMGLVLGILGGRLIAGGLWDAEKPR